MASNESFKQAIKAYLDKRAEEDSLFAPKYANEKKSIDECCSYIICMECGERFSAELVKRKRAVCPHCGRSLPLHRFYNRTVRCGDKEYRCLTSWCKMCMSEVAAERNRNN